MSIVVYRRIRQLQFRISIFAIAIVAKFQRVGNTGGEVKDVENSGQYNVPGCFAVKESYQDMSRECSETQRERISGREDAGRVSSSSRRLGRAIRMSCSSCSGALRILVHGMVIQAGEERKVDLRLIIASNS